MKKVLLLLSLLSISFGIYAQDMAQDNELAFDDNMILSSTNSTFSVDPIYKNPAIAFLFSTITPGLGQMYNDQVGKGFAFLVVSGVSAGLFYGLQDITPTISLIFGVAFVATYIWQWIDAPVTANRLNIEHGYSLSLRPTVFQNNLAQNSLSGATAGLSLSLSF